MTSLKFMMVTRKANIFGDERLLLFVLNAYYVYSDLIYVYSQ
jgi:hypothetical protein